MSSEDKYKDIDNLLKDLQEESTLSNHLNDLFYYRLSDLQITKNQAAKILDIEHKVLESFLAGDSKKIDLITILKLSDFLGVSEEEIINKHLLMVKGLYNEDILIARKRSYIVNNFNLPSLKKIGLIESINDFEQIEKKINEFLGYKNIFEHSKHSIKAAFSSAKRKTNKENLNLWYAIACESLERTPNPNVYSRESLIEYFPKIRWNSMNVDSGFVIVAQELFRLGITVIVVPKITPDIHIRGATLCKNGKPCIVISKYTNFYATIWFTLLHELHHVLYDWEEIKKERYHLSVDIEISNINETEANTFAREYLFSDEKMKVVAPHINEHLFVKYFAEQNHVHESIIYTFYSWDQGEDECYGQYHKYLPSTTKLNALLNRFKTEEYLQFIPIKEISKKRNEDLYNLTK